MRKAWLLGLCGLVVWLGACESSPSPTREKQATPAETETTGVLLLSQAQFKRETGPDGKVDITPLPAKWVIVRLKGDHGEQETIEDPDSNAIHKVMPFDLPGETPGILTIGANRAPAPALLKIWRRTGNKWQAETIAKATFGGSFNRFRDIEIGDVTGDGKPEMVIATHDMGVVYVLEKRDGVWQKQAIDSATERTFVHEIEIGDIDGDGRNEIFATPSEPNRVGGVQGGHVVMYRYANGKFTRHVIEDFASRHVKEILLADVDGSGTPVLFAVLEVGLGKQAAPTTQPEDGLDPNVVAIKEYKWDGQKLVGRVVATLPDVQCRFLMAGDVDHDGRVELVAAAFKTGLWVLERDGQQWRPHVIDRNSSGYEHASVLADLDGDGTPEIYVAADEQHRLRRYRWDGHTYERTDLLELTPGDITWCVMPCPTSLVAP